MSWTDAQISLAKELFHQRMPASQAATILGFPSRNAVCGFWFRQGLMRGKREAKPRPPKALTKPVRIKQWRAPIVKPLPKPVEAPLEAPKSREVPFSLRTDMQCSWIAGEPSADAVCCGHQVQDGSSFCSYHSKIVFIKPERRL